VTVDYTQAFAISASGMAVETLRLEVIATNLANVYSAALPGSAAFRPLQLISAPVPAFGELFDSYRGLLAGTQVVGVVPTDVPDRVVYEPGHPAADERGFVAYPGINPVVESVNLISAIRAYDANVMAFNATKTMALRALDLGSTR
jgi:flagellar basal-body rod protein FlgC